MEKSVSKSPSPDKPKLLDRLRSVLRLKHCSIRTETTYVDWARRFILFHGKRHPETKDAEEVTAFLNHSAQGGGVAASTQNEALSALLFLYKEVLAQPLGQLGVVERPQRLPRVPVVLS